MIVVGFTAYQFLSNYRDKKESLKERGINPESVTIRAVDVESVWQYDNVAYEVKKIYLTPDIADIGNWRDNFDIGIKSQFVVVETNVRDRRTNGERRNITTTPFLRIRVDNIESSPKDADYLYLNPQEDGKVFSVFIVDKEIQEITLLSGITSSPRVTKIDFFGSNAEMMEGVFLYKTGFSPEYPDK